jgi:hypothetical protein
MSKVWKRFFELGATKMLTFDAIEHMLVAEYEKLETEFSKKEA